jgi:hypothetical protein
VTWPSERKTVMASSSPLHGCFSRPQAELLADAEFESRDDRERRLWTEAGADVAFFLLEFLKGTRRRDIQLSEIETTRLYKQSSEAEKRALRYVAAQLEPFEPTPTETAELDGRDNTLLCYARGEKISGAWVRQITEIPTRLRERDEFDRRMFSKQYSRPEGLFDWIFARNRAHAI